MGGVATRASRSVINAETLHIVQAGYSGGPTGVAFTGLLATSGTLTRTVGTDTLLDALNEAFVDLRSEPRSRTPKLVILHPQTWAALRREKDSTGRYILGLPDGPASLAYDGSRCQSDAQRHYNGVPEQGHFDHRLRLSEWGVPVCETTQRPAGTGVVLSVKAGAAVGSTRMGMSWSTTVRAELTSAKTSIRGGLRSASV